MEKKEIILPNKLFKKSNDSDLDIRVGLESSPQLMRIGDRDIILDIAELFNKERQESKNYKVYGKLKMVFKNLYSGVTEYNHLKKRLYLVGDGTENNNFPGYLPYDEFAFLRRDVDKEMIIKSSVSGNTLGVYNPQFITTTGTTGHTTISIDNAPYHNWNLHLSYVYSADTSYSMIYTLSGATKIESQNILHFTSGDGIPFRCQEYAQFYELISPIKHGISQGEFISLSGSSLNGLTLSGRTYMVDSVGNETYDSENYVLNILKSQLPTGVTLNGLYLGKRVLDKNNISGTTSNYYVHKHKVLTNINDYILDKIGFESPIWEDEKKLLIENSANEEDVLVVKNRMESVLFDFKNSFILTGLTNNLGYTPTEIYVSVFFRNGNGYFDYPPKIGYKFNFHDDWIDEHFSGTTSLETSLNYDSFTLDSKTFKSGTTITSGTSGFTGAFVEYNKKEMKERIISEVFHKISNPVDIFDFGQDGNFSDFSGATLNNTFGLIYQPFYRVKLRELSPYTEISSTKDVYNLPENTLYDSDDKVWRWRDIYDHGYIDVDGYGTNYPFINNIHYVKNDINFYIRNERYYNNKQDGIAKFKSPDC